MISGSSIKCFLTTVETRSFSKTAERLFFTRQAISKQISSLEQALDVQLFYRGAERLELTPAGELYAEFFARTVEQYRQVNEKVAELEGRCRDRISICCPSMLDIDEIVCRALDSFTEKYPATKTMLLKVQPHEMGELLRTRKADVMIDFSEQNPREYRSVALKEYPLMVVVHRDCPGAREAVLSGNLSCIMPGSADMPRVNVYEPHNHVVSGERPFDVDNAESAESFVLLKKGSILCCGLNKLCWHPKVLRFETEETLWLNCVWLNAFECEEIKYLSRLLKNSFDLE